MKESEVIKPTPIYDRIVRFLVQYAIFYAILMWAYDAGLDWNSFPHNGQIFLKIGAIVLFLYHMLDLGVKSEIQAQKDAEKKEEK